MKINDQNAIIKRVMNNPMFLKINLFIMLVYKFYRQLKEAAVS